MSEYDVEKVFIMFGLLLLVGFGLLIEKVSVEWYLCVFDW